MTKSPFNMVPSEVSPNSHSLTAPRMRRVRPRGSTCLSQLQASIIYFVPHYEHVLTAASCSISLPRRCASLVYCSSAIQMRTLQRW